MIRANEIDWFDAGYVVAKGDSDNPVYPPMNDMEAQRAWLGGFGAGWAEGPDEEALGSNLAGNSVDEALTQALRERADLLHQLRAHGEGRASRAVH